MHQRASVLTHILKARKCCSSHSFTHTHTHTLPVMRLYAAASSLASPSLTYDTSISLLVSADGALQHVIGYLHSFLTLQLLFR